MAPDGKSPESETLEYDADQRDPLEGVALDRRYLMEQLIDRGGFGAVYEGRDLKFDSTVAIKVLFGERSADTRSFRKEAKLARRFKHPNVVEVYDYGIDRGMAYIVMEFLRGPRLDQIFKARGHRLPEEDLAKFIREITSALSNAHDQNLIHRDLKPANIKLVDEGRPSERFVLLDLGIAAQTDGSNTLRNATQDRTFSPAYASPEQFSADPVTHLSDIYSFGTILYELFTGRHPFPERTLLKLMQAIIGAPPPPFSEVAPDRQIPPGVEDVIRRCMAKKPEDRPQSLLEVREALLPLICTGDTQVLRGTTAGPYAGAIPDSTDPATMDTYVQGSGMLTAIGDGSQTLASVAAPEDARPRRWRMIAAAVLLFVGGLTTTAIVSHLSRSDLSANNSSATVTPGFSLSGLAALSLRAGESARFPLQIVRTAFDDPLKFRVEGLPEGVKFELPREDMDSPECAVSSPLDIVPCECTVTIVAAAGGIEKKLEFRLAITGPDVWLPAEPKFERAGDEPIRTVGGRNYYPRIERVLDDGTRVAFLLISEESDRPDRPRPFYMMENKAWIGLFEQFAQAHPERIEMDEDGNAKWTKGPEADGKSVGTADPSLPAVNISPSEAWYFAQWLAGPGGGLPTFEQWNTAAGYYEFQAKRLDQPPWNEWSQGPFRGRWDTESRPDVAVGRGDRGPAPVGSSEDDISPVYGCRDMAGNGVEITATVFVSQELFIPERMKEDQLLLTRGGSYDDSAPCMYADFPEKDAFAPLQANSRSPYYGFRVALNAD